MGSLTFQVRIGNSKKFIKFFYSKKSLEKWDPLKNISFNHFIASCQDASNIFHANILPHGSLHALL